MYPHWLSLVNCDNLAQRFFTNKTCPQSWNNDLSDVGINVAKARALQTFSFLIKSNLKPLLLHQSLKKLSL